MAEPLPQDPETLKALLAQILAQQGGGSMSPLRNEASGPPMGEPLPQMQPMPGQNPGSIENTRRAEDPMTPAHQMTLSGLMMMGPGGPMKGAAGGVPPWKWPAAGGIVGGAAGVQGAREGLGYEGNPLWPFLAGAVPGAALVKGGQVVRARYGAQSPPAAPAPGGPSPAGPEITTTRPPLVERMRQSRDAVGVPTTAETPWGMRDIPSGQFTKNKRKSDASPLVDALMGNMA